MTEEQKNEKRIAVNSIVKEIKCLKSKLFVFVTLEKFEDAAVLRDRIESLQLNLKSILNSPQNH